MSKVLELVMISFLLISAFFFGVAYSVPVKENFSWLFEVKEQEVEIPEIKKEQDIVKTINKQNTISEEERLIESDASESNESLDELDNNEIGQNIN